MRLNFFLLLASFLSCASAQSRITAPMLGYAYDPGLRVIRSIRGIPGAAVLGAPLRLGFVPRSAAVAPQQNYALAVSARGDVRLVRWNSAPPSATVLDGALAGPDRVIFSPSGAAAILYDSNSGQMETVAGLPDAPVIQEIQPAGSPPVVAMAITDDATVVLAAAGAVRTIDSGLNAVPLPLPGTVAALAFCGSSHDLLAVTQSGDLLLAKNVNANLDIRAISPGGTATADPVAVGFSTGGSAAFVANRAGTLSTIDLNTGSADSTSCQCSPTGLQPFGRDALFRLTGISDNRIVLFDGIPSHNRFWFVPAEAPRSEQ
jgi:hypothetical protein